MFDFPSFMFGALAVFVIFSIREGYRLHYTQTKTPPPLDLNNLPPGPWSRTRLLSAIEVIAERSLYYRDYNPLTPKTARRLFNNIHKASNRALAGKDVKREYFATTSTGS